MEEFGIRETYKIILSELLVLSSKDVIIDEELELKEATAQRFSIMRHSQHFAKLNVDKTVR